MLSGSGGKVRDVMNERSIEYLPSRMVECPGEPAQNGGIGRAFEVEHPSRDLRLVVVLKADLLQCLQA